MSTTVAVQETENLESETCPECDGTLLEERGETACIECGLVVDEDEIDHGPEWRAFDEKERTARRRVGSPRTVRLHDYGLGTEISYQTQASGQEIRFRKQHMRARFNGKAERNRAYAMSTIQRVGGQLELDGATIDRACYLFHTIQSDLLNGRSLEPMIAACLFAAVRERRLPITRDDITGYIAVPDERRVFKLYHEIVDYADVKPQIPTPSDFVERVATGAGLGPAPTDTAREYCRAAEEAEIHVGHQPMSIAATAVYVAASAHGQKLTQKRVAEVADCSKMTIREHRDALVEVADVE